jgi:hypothetical protein
LPLWNDTRLPIRAIYFAGHGWKTPRVIAKTSGRLRWAYDHKDTPLSSEKWKERIIQRDGAGSGSLASLHQAAISKLPGEAVNVALDKFVDETELPHRTVPDTRSSSEWDDRALLMTVRRGKEVDTAVGKEQDARARQRREPLEYITDFEGQKTWPEFLETYREKCFHCHNWTSEETADIYEDVDDIFWPHEGHSNPRSQ